MDKNKEAQIDTTKKVDRDYKRYIYPSLLVFFILLLVFSNYIYLSIEGNNLSEHLNDEIGHLVKSQHYSIELTRGNWISLIFQDNLISIYPPVVYLNTLVYYFLFGRGKMVAIASFIVFYLIIVFSTYFTGSLLFNRDAGFLAGLAILSAPLVALSTHLYILDLPLAAMVSLSIFLLFKSDYFRERLWTILFFISFGLAMLTKSSAVQYLAAPFAAVFAFFAYEQLKNRKTRIKFIIVIFSLMVIFASSLYLSNHQPLREYIHRILDSTNRDFILFYALFIIIFVIAMFLANKFQLDERNKNFMMGFLIFMIVIWHYYGMHTGEIFRYIKNSAFVGHMNKRRTIVESLLEYMDLFQGRLLTSCLVIGLLAFPFVRNTREQKILLFGFAVSALVIFSTPVANERYYIPLAVFSAMFACYWIPKIKFSWLRCPITVIFIVICFLGCFSWFIVYNYEYEEIYGHRTLDFKGKYLHQPPFTDDPLFTGVIDIISSNFTPDDSCIIYIKSQEIHSPFRPWAEPTYIDWIITKKYNFTISKIHDIPWYQYKNDKYYLEYVSFKTGKTEDLEKFKRIYIIYVRQGDFRFNLLKDRFNKYKDKAIVYNDLNLPDNNKMLFVLVETKGDAEKIIKEFLFLVPEGFGKEPRNF